MSRRIPALLTQRFQHSFPVISSDLLFFNHLGDHLLGEAGHGLLLAVENRHPCWENVQSRLLKENLLHQMLFSCCVLLFCQFASLTCVHGASQLDEALEGEVGDVRGRPHARLGVETFLVAPPSACLLPVRLLLLVLHWLRVSFWRPRH